MSNQTTTFVEQHPGFSQERTRLALDEIAKRETEPETGARTIVQNLFDYWQESCVGAPPAMVSFEPQRVFTPDEMRWISWINVDNLDPLNFILCNHPGRVFGDWSGKALGEYHNPFHARSCALEYLTCKTVQRPLYHEIKQTIGNVSRNYARLLLPVTGRNRQVTRLYYATRYIDTPTAIC